MNLNLGTCLTVTERIGVCAEREQVTHDILQKSLQPQMLINICLKSSAELCVKDREFHECKICCRILLPFSVHG